MRGNINLCKDIPADLIAVSSKFSPKFPKVMMDESKTARGRAIGTSRADAYTINSKITVHSNPFPARSSMYFHRNCINRMKREIKKVRTKGPKYDFNIKICNRFTMAVADLGLL